MNAKWRANAKKHWQERGREREKVNNELKIIEKVGMGG